VNDFIMSLIIDKCSNKVCDAYNPLLTQAFNGMADW